MGRLGPYPTDFDTVASRSAAAASSASAQSCASIPTITRSVSSAIAELNTIPTAFANTKSIYAAVTNAGAASCSATSDLQPHVAVTCRQQWKWS